MEASATLRAARHGAGLSLRSLAQRAHTSHSTLAAYEGGHKVPSVETLNRIIRSAGFALAVELRARRGGPDPAERGRELLEVLDLAAQFPARHASELPYPRFGSS